MKLSIIFYNKKYFFFHLKSITPSTFSHDFFLYFFGIQWPKLLLILIDLGFFNSRTDPGPGTINWEWVVDSGLPETQPRGVCKSKLSSI